MHQETPREPEIKGMPIEEKWDRLHDFFTLDHAVSYKTHKRMGTVQEWVDDTVEAYGKMMGRFMGPLADLMGKAALRLTPNLVLKQAINAVLYSDQMMHHDGEYLVSEPRDGEITVRFRNCLRLKKQNEIAARCELGFDGREICEVEKMHLTHPNHPTSRMRVIPVEITWEEGGCVWTFRAERP
jgi:hypothetical protein